MFEGQQRLTRLSSRAEQSPINQPSTRVLEEERPKTQTIPWGLGQLRKALESIGTKSAVDVNICLFVDALDEHDGNHRELISILVCLTRLTDNTFFRIRLCLAGRAENIFKDAFQCFPGFAIHELTTDDVRLYVEGRLRAQIGGKLTDKDTQKLNILIGRIVIKAEGVFLWVRLVVDELIEGLCEGDSIEELQVLLSTIPTELSEFYTRAIRRIRRTSSLMQASSRYEAFVMFQVATYCREHFSLDRFSSATLFLTIGRGPYSDLRRLSTNQMERRLYSRSAELLVASCSPERIVQFIHQTVKEYMRNGEGDLVTRENISNRNQESGHLLILRCIISLTQCFGSPYIVEQDFFIHNFLYYAQAVELHGEICITEYFEPTILALSEQRQHDILTQIIQDDDLEPRWANVLSDMRHHRRIQLLMFYILCCLPLSLRHSVASHKGSMTEKDACHLLEAALVLGSGRVSRSREQSSQALEILLEARIAIGISNHSLQSLDESVEYWDTHSEYSGFERRMQLWAQFRSRESSTNRSGR